MSVCKKNKESERKGKKAGRKRMHEEQSAKNRLE